MTKSTTTSLCVLIVISAGMLAAPAPCKKVTVKEPVCYQAQKNCAGLAPPGCPGEWTCNKQYECEFLCSIPTPSCPPDINICTIESWNSKLGCMHTMVENCLPEGALCAVSGKAGDIVECSIQLAAPFKPSTNWDSLAGAIVWLEYDPQQLKVVTLKDKICEDSDDQTTCTWLDSPAADPLPGGHVLWTNPPSLDDWNGYGGITMDPYPDQDDPNKNLWVNGAYVAAPGVVAGDPEVIRVAVQLVKGTDQMPFYVWVDGALGVIGGFEVWDQATTSGVTVMSFQQP